MKENMKTNRAVSSLMSDKMRELGITQIDIANAIERKSQSYVSDRLASHKSWSIGELDVIAPILGFPNALALLASASGYSDMK
jgi:hypothetical protein